MSHDELFARGGGFRRKVREDESDQRLASLLRELARDAFPKVHGAI
jgi:hypothetical protein